MERTEKPLREALSWLQYVLNPETEMPTVSDWPALFAFAEKQALVGICLPERSPANLAKDLLLQWIGHVQLIEQQNILLNKRVEKLFDMLEKEGFQCCLLKGQGNASLYPIPLRRCTGDIDIWIDTDETTAFQFVKNLFPDEKESYKHIHFPVFKDIQVDVHITPLKLYCGKYGKRLEEWILQNKSEQFNNKISLVETHSDICIPTLKFNIVYQLGHMLVHLFDEGMGMRQVVDYFYVLKGLNVTKKELDDLVVTIKALGLFRFAQAIMWIENNVLGLPVEQCILKPNEKLGKKLLDDILEGGNFGHHSKRYNGRSGFYYIGFVEMWRVILLLSIAPREGLARLFSKMRTAFKHTLNKLK